MITDNICRKYEGYIKQEGERGIVARCLQAVIRNPSKHNFKGMVHVNMIHDTNLKLSGYQGSHDIFGKNLIDIRRKTVRK